MTSENIRMIQAGQALQSLRDSGHSLPTALGEVIDNSIEANANRVDVVLEQSEERGKKRVHRIAIDNGVQLCRRNGSLQRLCLVQIVDKAGDNFCIPLLGGKAVGGIPLTEDAERIDWLTIKCRE